MGHPSCVWDGVLKMPFGVGSLFLLSLNANELTSDW